MNAKTTVTAVLIALAGGCDESPAEGRAPGATPTNPDGKADVWNRESRIEWYDLDLLDEVYDEYDAEGAVEAASSVVAVTTAELVADWEQQNDSVSGRFPVCEDEAFATQTAFRSKWSGVLVAEDLVLTAWHAVRDTPCEQLRFVFGYRLEAPGTVRTLQPETDIYACSSIVLPASFEEGQANYDDDVDLALVRLDRPVDASYGVATIAPAPWEMPSPTRMLSMGHPMGMALKIDPGFYLRDFEDSNLFEVGSDLFKGDSGGPFFDRDNRLIGVVKGGPSDFTHDQTAGCARHAVNLAKTNRGSWAEPILRQYCDEVDAGATWCDQLQRR